MSKNAPKRPGPAKPGAGQPAKPISWWLIGLWMLSLFMLMKSCNAPKATTKQAPQDALTEIQQLASNLQEGSALKLFNGTFVDQIKTQERSIDDQVKARKLAPQDAADKKAVLDSNLVEGCVTVSDALMIGAENTIQNGQLVPRGKGNGVYDKFQGAYQLLYNYQSQFGDSALWQKEFDVKEAGGTTREVSGDSLYKLSVDKLSAQNRESPVFGFIPGYQLIDWMVKFTHSIPGFSYWFAAFVLAVFVRGVIWPLSQHQLMWGRQMSQLAPMLKALKTQYAKDAPMLQKKQMELYKEYGLNPLAGCWPVLVQMPLYWAVYTCMLRYRFEFQKGTFLWINDQSSHLSHGFFSPNLGQKDNTLIVIYGVTLLISTLLTPVNDPTQVRQQRIIGVGAALIFPVMMITGTYPVPCAFVLYWTFTNLFATIQSLRAYYLLPVPPLVKVSTPVGGVYPTSRKQSWWERMQAQLQEQLEEKQRATEQQAKKVRDAGDDSGPKIGPKNGQALKPATKETSTKVASTPRKPGTAKKKPKRRTP